jgi:hypothetical protein
MVNMSGKMSQLTVFPLQSLSRSQAATIRFTNVTSFVALQGRGSPKENLGFSPFLRETVSESVHGSTSLTTNEF